MPSDKEFFENNQVLKSIVGETKLKEEADTHLLKEKLLAQPIWTYEDLINFPSDDNNYLIEKFLWENQVVFLIAKDKIGKSILSKQMCCSLSSGTPFLDCYSIPRPFKVLYIQLEGDRADTKKRLQAMTKQIPIMSENFRYMFKAKIWLNVQSDVDQLMKDIDSTGFFPEVICIDPLYTAVQGSLSVPEVASAVICQLRTIQEKYQCCILINHHEHKKIRNHKGFEIDEGDDSIMGSSLFKNFANHILRLSGDKKTKLRDLTCDTQRNGQVVESLHLKLSEPDPLFFHLAEGVSSPLQTNVLNFLVIHGSKTVKEIMEGAGISLDGSVRTALHRLEKEGKVKRNGHNKHSVLWEAIK